MQRRQALIKSARLVVKVGTALLTSETGVLNQRFIAKLAEEIADLRQEGREVILVSSGAIGSGIHALKAKQRPRTIPAKQAMAAIGQPRLMQAYAKAFENRGLMTAQILLTSEDIHNRQRYSHARNALFELLRLGVIPIFNENDTVAVDEIKFGNNDILAAHITHLAGADLLIILTDVEGLYAKNPVKYPDAPVITEVEKIDFSIEQMAGGTGGCQGTGGMATKILAAKMVTGMGEEVVIAGGRTPKVLARILAGESLGTVFYPQGDKLSARKRWIAYALLKQGSLTLDPGACVSVQSRGKSLLSSGIVAVEGDFQPGDCVGLEDLQGNEFARGLVNYSAGEISKLCGKKSTEIEKILGYKNTDEIIHRDDLTVLK